MIFVDSDRVLEIKVRVKVNPHRTWNQDTSEWVDREVPLFTLDQWVYIEKLAFEHLRDMVGNQVTEMITPEVDFDPSAGAFPDPYTKDEDISDEEVERREDYNLEAAGAVIDVLEAFMSQVDEEIGKRDI